MLRPSESSQARLRDAFFDFVRDSSFPCLGAKAALARDGVEVLIGHSITSSWNDFDLHDALMKWASDYREQRTLFRSFVAIYSCTEPLDERQFETALWDRLQSLADKDAWRAQVYDERVSPYADDPHFSVSFGGEAFFVIGMHPNASRPARRFSHPAIVFNLHDQFEQLRTAGKYEPLRQKILRRDEDVAGSVNPMLARHGETSEARQYSGRAVETGWRCPFKDPRA
jgi:hypothetical protein